ncbi:MAG: diaminopimelate epimerase [Flavipsychrobacter sp.]
MIIQFHKYQGTGNDFILIDNRAKGISLTKDQVAFLCHRRFGIGADGLMLLQDAEGYDFRMVYYNSDGGESTMCGNGGRCITAFAKKLGLVKKVANFIAIDGAHFATINEDGTVSLHMQDVQEINAADGHTTLNTGSPHYVQWVNDVQNTDVFTEGRRIRNRDEFQPKGINVNFVQLQNGKLWVRTYERGVEDETLSCGTGVTASAIAATANATGEFNTTLYTPGGTLNVSFIKDSADTARNVVLSGPATFVFEGAIEL